CFPAGDRVGIFEFDLGLPLLIGQDIRLPENSRTKIAANLHCRLLGPRCSRSGRILSEQGETFGCSAEVGADASSAAEGPSNHAFTLRNSGQVEGLPSRPQAREGVSVLFSLAQRRRRFGGLSLGSFVPQLLFVILNEFGVALLRKGAL